MVINKRTVQLLSEGCNLAELGLKEQIKKFKEAVEKQMSESNDGGKRVIHD